MAVIRGNGHYRKIIFLDMSLKSYKYLKMFGGEGVSTTFKYIDTRTFCYYIFVIRF